MCFRIKKSDNGFLQSRISNLLKSIKFTFRNGKFSVFSANHILLLSKSY